MSWRSLMCFRCDGLTGEYNKTIHKLNSINFCDKGNERNEAKRPRQSIHDEAHENTYISSKWFFQTMVNFALYAFLIMGYMDNEIHRAATRR